jgi:hypothetical protein
MMTLNNAKSTETPLPVSNMTYIAVLEKASSLIVTVESVQRRFGVDMLIRLQAADFANLAALTGVFVHFNLETTLNEVGHRCAILPIVTSGRRLPDGQEVLPVVDMNQYRLGRCIEVTQRVPLSEISADLFAYSLPTVKSTEQLRATLIQRYTPMFPLLTQQDIEARGCAVTKLILDEL